MAPPVTVESRICHHMNLDHQLSLFAIVKSTLTRSQRRYITIKDCKMETVDLNEAKISYVACHKESCAKKEVIMKFEPPLESYAEIRGRLVGMHHENLEPSFLWLLTEPASRTVLFAMSGLCYAHHFLDIKELVQENDILTSVFGSDGSTLTSLIQASYIFGVSAHVVEAFYGVYLCKKELKLRNKAIVLWFLVIMLVGYPMTAKVVEFVNIDKESKKAKKES